MTRGFAGQRCLVTGAASGIGAAVAQRLVDGGAEVIGLDIREASTGSRFILCDLSNPTAIASAVDQVGHVDVLCNVAGIPATHPAERVLAVNFLGPRELTRALLPSMPVGGAIVNVASTAGFRWADRLEALLAFVSTDGFDTGTAWYAEHRLDETAPDGVGPYEISKEAMTVWTMLVCTEAWARGVRMNAVSPGPVETPILGDFEITMGKGLLDSVKAAVGRHAQPADIAPVVTFLASADARWINGTNVLADGGAMAGMAMSAIAVPDSATHSEA